MATETSNVRAAEPAAVSETPTHFEESDISDSESITSETTMFSDHTFSTDATEISRATEPEDADQHVAAMFAAVQALLPPIILRYAATPRQPAERSLVTVRRIMELEDADEPELQAAWVDGRHLVVVPKGEFSVDDLVVYIKPNAFLPASTAPFDALDEQIQYRGTLGHRVGMRKVSNLISQGLLYAIQDIPLILMLASGLDSFLAGDDATTIGCLLRGDYEAFLGVTRWEVPPVDPAAALLGDVPLFVPETGVQFVKLSRPARARAESAHEYQETAKKDGIAIKAYFLRRRSPLHECVGPLPEGLSEDAREHMLLGNGRFGLCTEEGELNHSATSIYWRAAIDLDLPAKLNFLDRSVVVCGVLCGSTINGNPYGFAPGSYEFYVFDVFDIERMGYLPPRMTVSLAELFNIPHVPVLSYGDIPNPRKMHEALLLRARNVGGKGVVYKSTHNGQRFEVINGGWPFENR